MLRGASDVSESPAAQLAACCDSCWASLLHAFRWCLCWPDEGYEAAPMDERPEAAGGGAHAAAHYQAPAPHAATVLEDLRRSPERPPLPPKGAELQTGPGSSRRRPQGGSDSGTDTDAEPGSGRARPRRCRSREALAEAAAASREQLAAAARGGRSNGLDAGGEPPTTPGLKQRVKSGLSLASEDEDFCSTCLEGYSDDNPQIWTNCRHHFHLACIYEWLERKETCPIWKQRCIATTDREEREREQQPRRDELLELPDELLALVLPSLAARDLATLVQVCKKFNGLAGLEQRWQALYSSRFGCSTLSEEAAKLAGAWHCLYKLKHLSDQTANGWERLSHVEMRAAAARFAKRTVTGRLQVVFLLDGSGSVTEDDFQAMTGFTSLAVEELNGLVPELQVAVVQFASEPRVELPLQPIETAAFQACVADMGRMNGGTNIAQALGCAGQLLRAASLDGDAARVLVLLTDGRLEYSQRRETAEVARRLADELSARVFAMGVGRGVVRCDLEQIVAADGAGDAAERYLPLRTLADAPW
ncbi:hypothetical protein WJX81_007814 [Elliptochloris bilobata]|uniref:RING-type E3 ubiquitin transferase n=1 Tax=Elliptochloris bilobata TaxID=381761 RepID=A0AAW1SEZ8_9CHLO